MDLGESRSLICSYKRAKSTTLHATAFSSRVTRLGDFSHPYWAVGPFFILYLGYVFHSSMQVDQIGRFFAYALGRCLLWAVFGKLQKYCSFLGSCFFHSSTQ
jgi:hypothetical protein